MSSVGKPKTGYQHLQLYRLIRTFATGRWSRDRCISDRAGGSEKYYRRRCRARGRALPCRAPKPPSHGARALNATVAATDLPFPLRVRGKVRDVYDLGDALLMVATDRVSAFDVVMPDAVPRKGEVLTLLSAWWFARTADLVPNHLLSVDPEAIAARYPALAPLRDVWARRSMLVRKLEKLAGGVRRAFQTPKT